MKNQTKYLPLKHYFIIPENAEVLFNFSKVKKLAESTTNLKDVL
jgi:hypothetical protein